LTKSQVQDGEVLSYTKIQRLKRELDSAIADNDFELALESINDMIKLDHDNDQYWNSRGVILSKLDLVEESLLAFDQALEFNPKEARIWYSKGCVLMDNDKHRAALACFYKSLDSDPAFEKARDRFLRCLDDLVLLDQANIDEAEEEETIHEDNMDEEEIEENEEEKDTPEIMEPKARKKKGTYLDDDMFSGEFSDEDEEEEPEDMEEEWGDDEDEDDDEDWGEDDEEEMEFIVCRCGEKVLIGSEKRPYRFKCKECGRGGTLK
jgi:tetratricopeptide (TPR) repeat protein